MPVMRKMTLAEAINTYGATILDHLEKVKDYQLGTGVFVYPPVVTDGEYRISPEIEAIPSLITPFADHAELSSLSAVYVEVNEYTITKERGYLQELSIYSNKPLTVQWRVTIDETVLFTNQKLQTTMSIRWNDNDGKGLEVATGGQILVEMKSDGFITALCDALMVGTEEQ